MSQPTESQVFSGRYKILRHLARGGMAEVYVAHDVMLDRTVALKMLFRELSTDRSFVERFRREAQAAANLSHPNIVSIYDWGEEEGTYFIVMEYIEGRTLGQVIRSEGPLLPDRAADIAADVAAALHYAHQSGVVHRDVKPGNVLVSATTGAVKVTDFGIARAANTDQDLTQTGSVMGTATYFSPEQAQGHKVDARSDIYSLGVVLYEMLVGRPPFQGDNPMAIAYKHVREEPVPPRQANPHVPVELEAIVLQAMAKNPNDRYVTSEELRQDLLRFRQGRAVLANPTVAVPVVSEATVAAPAVDRTQVVDRTMVGAPVTTARQGPPAPPKRGVGPFLVLLVVMLAVLGGLLYLFGKEAGLFGDSSAKKVTMPNVVGKLAEDATKQLEDLKLDVAQKTEIVTDEAQVGRVMAQDPAENSPVDEGAAVTITVGAAPEKVKVPLLVGRNLDVAKDLLAAAGLNPNITEETSSTVADNEVIRQSPAPQTEVAKGSNVDLVVSAGKAQKTVPDVVGKDRGDAANELGQAGFKTKTVLEASDKPKDEVIRTDPGAGEKLDEGSTVTMVVSSGPPKAVVPGVVGKTAAEAKAAIEGAGLVYEERTETRVNPDDNGKVVTQSPSGGAEVAPGSTVRVVVGRYIAGNSTTTTSSP